TLYLAFVLAVFATPISVRAQQPSDWLGKRVVQKYSNFQLQIEAEVIDTEDMIHTYRVEQVNGPWLWLRAEGENLTGWAPADSVVPVEKAIEFFTPYILQYPADPHGYTMRGMIWQERKNGLDLAVRDFTEAIRLDPANPDMYHNRASAWQDKKEYAKAIADFSEAIRL